MALSAPANDCRHRSLSGPLGRRLFAVASLPLLALALNLIILLNALGQPRGDPLLFRRIAIPDDLLAGDRFAGDVRIGDVNGDGDIEFLVYRSRDNGMKPCFIGVFDGSGRVLWRIGRGGEQPARPGPVSLYDFDGDGRDEILCFFVDPSISCPPESMENVVLQIRAGDTGLLLREAVPEKLRACQGQGPNWVHQRLLIARLRPDSARPSDFVVKVGSRLLAFDERFEILWTYDIPWNEYSRCSAYIPALGDLDGDGLDEINGGYYLLDHDGRPLWEKPIARHMDSVAIAPWDDGAPRAFASGYGHILRPDGSVLLKLGEEIVPHGQELRVADFDPTSPGPEMLIRYRGHEPSVLLVNNRGQVVRRFELNSSPNETGMTEVYWNGPAAAALLYNGGMLWRGTGQPYASFPELPDPVGPPKMGWYHCFPANVCSDEREEVVLYNPWDRFIWIYTPAPLARHEFQGYRPTSRQYNARLMD